MKGYWTGSCYVGFMPDGNKRYFVSDTEYHEAYHEEEVRSKNTSINEKKDD